LFAALGGEALVLVAALLIASLFFFAPLRCAPLLFLAPLRGTPLFFLTALLLETRGLSGARVIGGSARVIGRARCGDCAFGLSGGAFGIGRSIGPSDACRLLRRSHRLLRRSHRLGSALCFRGPFGLDSTRGFLSGAHRLLGRASGLGRARSFGGAVRVGALLGESLRLSDLASGFGGTSRLFGRAPRLLRCARRVR
jgi:hypothetical protein